MMHEALSLDSPKRYEHINGTILSKPALYDFYRSAYKRFDQSLRNCPAEGQIIEIGSGGGFLKDVIPEAISTDIIKYPHIDRCLDATSMEIENNSVKAIFMLSVFHHIPSVEKFFLEAIRCLKPGGKIYIVDSHLWLMTRFILKYIHHEPYDPYASSWDFESSGPLSDANTALTWIVFKRDRKKFNEMYGKHLEILNYSTHSTFQYWLSGGLKSWTLSPYKSYKLVKGLDKFITMLFPNAGSFVDIEIEKKLV